MPMAGISVVGTLPEYRRQGLLRRITEQSFLDMRERGQHVAALWASQAAIYQRYGYSLCSVMRRYEIDTVDAVLLREPDPSFAVSRESAAESYDAIKEIYRQFVAHRSLYLHRSKLLWQANALREVEAEGPVHVAVCRDGDGNPNGYAIYTLREGKVDHPARSQELRIRDMAWLNIDACRALWSFLGRHDLVGRMVWESAPADDPAIELFAEPRMLRMQDREGAYFRIVDAQAALESRGYDSDGEILIGMTADREAPWNDGTYRLTVSGGEADVQRVDGTPEVTFTIKSLASAFSGFRRVRQLCNWGLADGSEQAIDRADALFATRHAPHSPDHF
jgi:predicted acetyltransferase